jgi:hypothetical protein
VQADDDGPTKSHWPPSRREQEMTATKRGFSCVPTTRTFIKGVLVDTHRCLTAVMRARAKLGSSTWHVPGSFARFRRRPPWIARGDGMGHSSTMPRRGLTRSPTTNGRQQPRRRRSSPSLAAFVVRGQYWALPRYMYAHSLRGLFSHQERLSFLRASCQWACASRTIPRPHEYINVRFGVSHPRRRLRPRPPTTTTTAMKRTDATNSILLVVMWSRGPGSVSSGLVYGLTRHGLALGDDALRRGPAP